MSKKKARNPSRRVPVKRAPPHAAPSRTTENFQRTQATRELFWNNVIREILTSLSMLSMIEPENPPPLPAESAAPSTDETQPGDQPREDSGDLLDGRLGLITTQGQRIPIAAVYPLFACGIPGSDAEKSLSLDVECSVFQVHTPHGEVYTLPLHEIRGFHAVGEEAMEQIKAASQATSPDDSDQPFGFAAFTTLARRSREAAGNSASASAPARPASS